MKTPTLTAQVCRVLVVDDSPDDRAEVRRLLLNGSERRYKFAEAETGAAALSAVHGAPGGPPDCIVLDYSLPDINAVEVLEALTGPGGLAVCPVVVLTGSVGGEHTRAVLRAGAQDYVGKAWMTPEGMARAVENAIERWELGRELWASEQRFRLAARAAHAMVYELNLRAMRVTSLHGLDALLGYHADEAELSLAWWDGRIHPEDLPRCHAAFQALRAAPRDQTIEYRVRHKDGRTLWVEDRVTPVLDAAGELVQLVGTVVDVTDRRRAEEAVRASQGRLKEAQRIARIGSWTWEPPIGRVWWSDVIYDLFGLARGDVEPSYETFLSVVHPDDRPVAVRRVEAVFAGADGFADDLRIIAPDGRQVWIHSQARVTRAPDGRVILVEGTDQDITARKLTEQALQTSEERLARAQKAAGVGTWDWDIATGQAAWTDEAWELFGPATRPEPVTYEFWLACVHPGDRERAAATSAAALAGGSYHDEFRVCRHDGSVLWLASDGAVVRGADGRPVRLLGTVRDVTERKRAEAALQDADRRKDEFLATLAHELRNPLAPIRNGLQVVRLGGVPERAEKTIAMMERQLGHMIELIDDLLDVSRVRTGKITLRHERVAVRYIVESAVEACLPTIDAKGHALELDLPTDPLVLDGDRTRLVQVVANLLTNAAKYSERGGRIRVAAARDGAWVVVRVSDTGVGIAPELLPTLWDMFTQVRDTLDKAQGGLGIGLSLVKKLVEMHGGTATAESAGIGQGSTFVLRLPLAQPAAAASEILPVPEADKLSGPSLRVLVVDDNEDAAESLAELLQIHGHTTRTAHTGLRAIDTVREFGPDVVFLDLGLPGIDGYEVARRLRVNAESANLALVALTGWGSEDDKRRTEEVGFDAHLTKPVERNQVVGLLARLSSGQIRA